MTDFAEKVSIDDVFCKKDTGNAILCVIEGDEYWIPHSQIDDDSEVYGEGHRGELVISEWIAIKKGLAF